MTESDALPTPCPHCQATLETRGDAMIHLLKHFGDSPDNAQGSADDVE